MNTENKIVRSCATCQFAQKKVVPPNIEPLLSCHRMPPSAGVLVTPHGPQQYAAFPVLSPGMFCYEYVPEGELIDRARNPEPASGVSGPGEHKLIVS